MLRAIFAPWVGEATSVPVYERNLIHAIKGQIINEIWNVVVTPTRACAYDPFIMSMIEHVSQKTFVKDNKHTDLKPQAPSVHYTTVDFYQHFLASDGRSLKFSIQQSVTKTSLNVIRWVGKSREKYCLTVGR
jgi:hypothetical protein